MWRHLGRMSSTCSTAEDYWWCHPTNSVRALKGNKPSWTRISLPMKPSWEGKCFSRSTVAVAMTHRLRQTWVLGDSSKAIRQTCILGDSSKAIRQTWVLGDSSKAIIRQTWVLGDSSKAIRQTLLPCTARIPPYTYDLLGRRHWHVWAFISGSAQH